MTAKQTQAQSKLPPDQAAASLAFGTKLSEGLLGQAPQGQQQGQQPQGQPDASQSPQNAPGATQAPQQPQTPTQSSQPDIGALMTKMELNITKQLDSMRKEMKDDTQKEIAGIKNDLKSALQDEDTEETKTPTTSN